jgi:hypothetical protein
MTPKRSFNCFEGTAIADLRSLVDWVRGFEQKDLPRPSVGCLNYTLALVALVVCEACGFYVTGASKTGDCKEMPRGVGTYDIHTEVFFP